MRFHALANISALNNTVLVVPSATLRPTVREASTNRNAVGCSIRASSSTVMPSFVTVECPS